MVPAHLSFPPKPKADAPASKALIQLDGAPAHTTTDKEPVAKTWVRSTTDDKMVPAINAEPIAAPKSKSTLKKDKE